MRFPGAWSLRDLYPWQFSFALRARNEKQIRKAASLAERGVYPKQQNQEQSIFNRSAAAARVSGFLQKAKRTKCLPWALLM